MKWSWQSYDNQVLGTCIYLSSGTYVPGYINSVKVYPVATRMELQYAVIATDGYKDKIASYVPTIDEAKLLAEKWMQEGHDGWYACESRVPKRSLS